MSSISRLMIEQQFATIGVKTTNAQLHITTPRPQMEIENIQPEMTVDRQNPTFEVDWDAVKEQTGRTPVVKLTRQLAGKSYNKGMQAIGDIAREGDYLSKVERGGDRVVDIAKNKNYSPTQTEINLGLMPQRSPNVKWNPGYVNINWSRHQLIVEWDTEFMPEFKVDPPYSVEIFLRDKPYIKISIAEGEAPYEPGKVVDTSY